MCSTEYVADRLWPLYWKHHTFGWRNRVGNKSFGIRGVERRHLVAAIGSRTSTALRTNALSVRWNSWDCTIYSSVDSTAATSTGHCPLLTSRHDAWTTASLHALRQLHTETGFAHFCNIMTQTCSIRYLYYIVSQKTTMMLHTITSTHISRFG